MLIEQLRLSPHFTLREFTRSAKANELGIDNSPNQEHLYNLSRLASVLENVRTVLKAPILISSGYRSPALNRAVGGSSTSDHANGLAADFTAPKYGSVFQVCQAIVASGLPFDQLIFEQGDRSDWVHFGIGTRMRQQVMSWSPKTKYVPGLKVLR